MQEIKKLNAQIIAIRSEMSKNEDQLKDFHRYRAFLEKLTPNEWLNVNVKSRKEKDESKTSKQDSGTKKGKKSDVKTSNNPAKVGDEIDINGQGFEYDYDYTEEDEAEEEAPLFFNSPQQLLDIFAELEENNLSLIQNCQEMEETLEELKQKTIETEKNM